MVTHSHSSSRVADAFTTLVVLVYTPGIDIQLGTHVSIKNTMSELKRNIHTAGSDMVEKKVWRGSIGTADLHRL